MEMSTSTAITHWFHTHNPPFTPRVFTEQVIQLFLQSLRKFRLNLDVSIQQFNKVMLDAVCTFYYAKQRLRTIEGPRRTFSYPKEWSTLCEESWQDALVHSFFSLEYWDNFWKQFPTLYDVLLDIQPFLTAILPLYVRRSLDILVDKKYIIRDYTNDFIRYDSYESEHEEEDIDYYYKSKKQKKLLNDN